MLPKNSLRYGSFNNKIADSDDINFEQLENPYNLFTINLDSDQSYLMLETNQLTC